MCQGLLEEVLAVLVDKLLVVGNQGLGQGLADSVDLRGVATTGHSDADVDLGELVKTDDEDGLVDLLRAKRCVSGDCSRSAEPLDKSSNYAAMQASGS